MKIKIPVIILLVFFSTVCYAGEIATYKGFPLYPPEQAQEYKNQNVKKISVKLFTPESLNIVFKNNEEVFNKMSLIYEALVDKIDKAAEYVKRNAALLGWKFVGQDDYKDGGSFDCLFYKEGNSFPYVIVFFNRSSVIVVENKMKFDEEFGVIQYDFMEKLPEIFIEQGRFKHGGDAVK